MSASLTGKPTEAIPPGANPGGFYVMIWAGGETVYEGGFADASASLAHARIAKAYAAWYGEARTFIYDGSTGECYCTLINTKEVADEL